jgi:hypothetical protein
MRVDEIADLFRTGLSIREVSRRTGICFSVVRSHLIRSRLHQVQHRRVRDGMAPCRRCGRKRPTDEFPALRDGKYRCRDCLTELSREVQARRRGCTPEQYQALLEKQDGRCAICGVAEGHRSCHGTKCRLAIDHDHRTGATRGLLCNNCNRGLGRFKDSIAILESALRYLKREQ